jgi:riboflavin kinase / FMN adenylyltransferase
MILITDLGKIKKKFTSSILTLGNFDGLHLGHQELIRQIIRRAEETASLSMVVTFRPHPLKILAPEKCPPLISTYEEKIRLMEDLGIDVLVKIPFTIDFAAMEPRHFVKDVLVDLLGAKEIYVGYNYRFGKGRTGDIRMLKELGREFGFLVREIEQVALDGEVISSTRIRQLLQEGDVQHAAKFLGRKYALCGIVIKGDGRGRGLGFPTANIASKHAIVPANGVYAVRVFVREKYYDGIANIGLRPTFDTDTLAIEVHIFDFDEDLYGEEIMVYFLKRLREERKFPDITSLTEQIQRDIEEAKKVLAEPDTSDISSG